MTTSELKNGAVVETRNGNTLLKVDNTLLNINFLCGYMPLDAYTEDLKNAESNSPSKKDWDIMKVNNDVVNPKGYLTHALYDARLNSWTWVRPKPILDEVEKDHLGKICKPYNVTRIAKHSYKDLEYIEIKLWSECLGGEDRIMLPYFEMNTMYKNMEIDREYTPTDLGL